MSFQARGSSGLKAKIHSASYTPPTGSLSKVAFRHGTERYLEIVIQELEPPKMRLVLWHPDTAEQEFRIQFKDPAPREAIPAASHISFKELLNGDMPCGASLLQIVSQRLALILANRITVTLKNLGNEGIEIGIGVNVAHSDISKDFRRLTPVLYHSSVLEKYIEMSGRRSLMPPPPSSRPPHRA